MKKIIISLFIVFTFFLQTFASDIDTINQQIIQYQNNINSIEQKKVAMKKEYDTAIENQKIANNVAQQQNAWQMNKLWLAYSNSTTNSSWDDLIKALEDELSNNLLVFDNQIKDYQTEISKLNDEKNTILAEEKKNQQEKNDKEMQIIQKKEDNLRSYNSLLFAWINYLNKKKYDKAIEYFLLANQSSSTVWDLYSANYYLWLTYYNIWNLNYSRSYLENALEHTEDKQKINDTNKILQKIDEEQNKEKNNIVPVKNTTSLINSNTGILDNKQNSQVDAIFNKLEKKLAKLDENKKIDTYKSISSKLSSALKKSKNTKLNIIIWLLIEKIDNYVKENSVDLESEVLNIINN